MKAEPPTLRKISVLMASLDESTMTKILATLPPEDAAQIRRAVRHAPSVSPRERQEVLREFMELDRDIPEDTVAGIEIDASLAELLAESNNQPRMSPTHDEATPDEETPWGFLYRLNRAQLARRLERETPQVVAVVLAQLPPHHGAEVLHALPREFRQAVIERMTRLENQDPMIVDAIRLVLQKEFPDQVTIPTKVHPPGWEAARAIMEASHLALRRELTQHLAESHVVSPIRSSDAEPTQHVSVEPRTDWTPPWLELFAEQPNPWHFDDENCT